MRELISSVCSALALVCLLTSETADATDTPVANTSNIHSITLPHFEPVMPIAPGREEFMRACVACHSARYVVMQPPFPRRQWEETVNKMIKTYGAPADAEQGRAIVDYLEAVHGVVPMAKAPPSTYDDDDSGAVASPMAQQPIETFPMLAVAGDDGEHAQEVSRGAAVFEQNCAGCHGAGSRGEGVVSQVLLRKPADLTSERFNVSFLSQVLWNGVRGTSMPSWRSLPRGDLNAVAAYVQSLHPDHNPDRATPETLARGAALFIKNCAPCHGEVGDGKSAASRTLSPPPANLKWIQPDFDFELRVLRDGIPGTAMPSWKDQISESDREALAAFVRSLYESTEVIEGH
jgi:cbb3-type cytochrome c oxidase subunit III